MQPWDVTLLANFLQNYITCCIIQLIFDIRYLRDLDALQRKNVNNQSALNNRDYYENLKNHRKETMTNREDPRNLRKKYAMKKLKILQEQRT